MPVTDQDNALPITIRSVTKTYGDVYALDEVDLDEQLRHVFAEDHDDGELERGARELVV